MFLGVLLVLIGLLMLVGPGQGTLTILVGIIMMDYPRKKPKPNSGSLPENQFGMQPPG